MKIGSKLPCLYRSLHDRNQRNGYLWVAFVNMDWSATWKIKVGRGHWMNNFANTDKNHAGTKSRIVGKHQVIRLYLFAWYPVNWWRPIESLFLSRVNMASMLVIIEVRIAQHIEYYVALSTASNMCQGSSSKWHHLYKQILNRRFNNVPYCVPNEIMVKFRHFCEDVCCACLWYCIHLV